MANNDEFRKYSICDDDENPIITDESSSSHIVDKLINYIISTQPRLIYYDNVAMKFWQNLKFDLVAVDNDGGDAQTFATLNSQSGLKIIDGMKTRLDPPARHFRIGVTESGPYMYPRRDSTTNEILRDERGSKIFEGYCIDFIVELSSRMSFTYELVEPPSGSFGERIDNDGNFDGLVGALTRGEIDFVVANMKISADREEVIDFVIPYFDETGILIVMKKPLPDHSLFKFMTVLRLEVWLSILAALCITAMMIWLLDIFSPYSSRNWNYGENCR